MRVLSNYFRKGRQGFRRAPRVLVVSAVALVAVAAVAFADEIINDLPANDLAATLEEMNLTEGGATGSTTISVVEKNGDGKNGCNIQGTLPQVTFSVTSSDTSVATVSPSSITVDDCGDTHVITVTPVGDGEADVTFAQTANTTAGTWNPAPANFTVNVADGTPEPQNQTISFPTPTPSYTYGDAAFDPGATATSGLAVSYSSDTLGVCSVNGSNLVEILAAGTCTITGSQAGNSSYNAATPVQESYTINPKGVTGNITAANKVYDGTTAASATAASPSLTGVINSDDVSLTVPSPSIATFDTKHVGTGKTVSPGALSGYGLTGADAANYTLTGVNNTTADITQLAITVTADNKSKAYADPPLADPALTYTVSGGINNALAPGDSFTGALIRAPGEAIIGSPWYPITQNTLAIDDGNNGGNYALTFNNGVFKITFGTGTGCGTILQPINAVGPISIFNKKQTVPAKFRVCDANGNPIYVPGTVTGISRVNGASSAVGVVESAESTTATPGFRWSATDQQWIWNIDGKTQPTGTNTYTVSLIDGGAVVFTFGLK